MITSLIFDIDHDKNNEDLKDLTRRIHIKMFPEEYDFVYDSIADAKLLKSKINPMSKEYI